MRSRPLTSYETWFHSAIQQAAELRTPQLATEFADYLIRSMSGFRLHRDGTTLSLVTSPVTVGTIPSHLKTSREICLWADAGLRPLTNDRLSAIAVRDNHIVLSTTHLCFDGISWILLMKRFARGEFVPQPQFLNPIDQILKDSLSVPLNPLEHVNSRLSMSSMPWNSRREPSLEDDIHSEVLFHDYKPSELKCYDSKTGKIVSFTDALWRSAILTAQAVRSQKSYGCFTWVNLRPFIKDYSVGCLIGPCSIIADGVSEKMTVGELEQKLRRDFTSKIKRKYYLDGMKSMIDNYPVPKPASAFFDVSNVGSLPIGGPFVDLWGKMTPTASFATNVIGLSSATTFGNENAKLTLRYPYSPFVFTRAEAGRAFRAIGHSLKHIGLERKVGDAIAELREVIG
jgi:hypothetical protein